ncbi:MAG: squalene--hopene cyclase [Verrucomicrobia bacterium]|nr:squalene--hopene cyclase [Verrucomicrobiota bacterium]NBU62588.1 squalene--hopene cyclase [Chlamydiota bacterium]
MSHFSRIDELIDYLVKRALTHQDTEGYFVYPLECDSTISSETILLMHSIDWHDAELERRLACYLRKTIVDDGWVRYPDGPYDLSASIKAYFALKCSGESENLLYMQAIAKKIREHGGLKMANVFTRCTLAQFRQIGFKHVPWMPVEMILQPKWSWFHLHKFAYWARAVVIPLCVTMTRKFKAINPKNIHLKELMVQTVDLKPKGLKGLFFILDKIGRNLDWLIPKNIRSYAERLALKWIKEHDNKEDGLGGIYTAMEYEIKALLSLGYSIDHPLIEKAINAIQRLEIREKNYSYMQPCISPVWDTSIAMHALRYTLQKTKDPLYQGLDWLASKQLIGVLGDWSLDRPNLKGGGWAFQLNNPFYPDLDDTAMCGWAMAAIDQERYKKNIEFAKTWLLGMQSKNGGFAAFSVDQNFDYLNLIPFADHGALLDPPTEDVTGRVLSFFGFLDLEELSQSIDKAVDYLKNIQQSDGSWWGRWGTNYLYGTFSALVGLMHVNISPKEPFIQKAVNYLLSTQHSDGGWGESCDSYMGGNSKKTKESSSLFHTAIVLIALMYTDHAHAPQVDKGIEYLLRRKESWFDTHFNAPGFPRVFYLKYHGYEILFPLWALGLYKEKKGI